MVLALAGSLGLVACGGDGNTAVVATPVSAEADALGDLALPASVRSGTAGDPLAELAELAPPDTSATATVPADLLPPV